MDLSLFEDKGAEEFDICVYGGPESGQPLTLTVRRDRKREVVVIDWEIDTWSDWENPRLYGRRYDRDIPAVVPEVDEECRAENPSKWVVAGNRNLRGRTGEIPIEEGTTTFFGFWLRGMRCPQPGGLGFYAPRWIPWSSDEPISFSVVMPYRFDSVGRLKKMKEEEDLKTKILQGLRERERAFAPRVEEPKKDRITEEFERAMKKADSLEEHLGLMNKAAEKEQFHLRNIEERLERGEIDPDTAAFLRSQTKQVFTNIIDMLAAQMPGTPRV